MTKVKRGRPREEDALRRQPGITVNLSAKDHEIVAHMAAQANTSKAAIIRNLVEKWLCVRYAARRDAEEVADLPQAALARVRELEHGLDAEITNSTAAHAQEMRALSLARKARIAELEAQLADETKEVEGYQKALHAAWAQGAANARLRAVWDGWRAQAARDPSRAPDLEDTLRAALSEGQEE